MAKIKIRNKKFRDEIKIKFNKGAEIRYWIANLKKLTEDIILIVQDYTEQGYTLSNRQLYYQLVSRGLLIDEKGEVANADPIYKKICNVINDLKYNGILDWDMFEDRSRPTHKNYTEESVEGAIERTIYSYNLDKLQDQDVYIEVWIEKDALTGVFKPICNEYDIRLVTNKGYTSSSFIYQAFTRFNLEIANGKKVHILYFGDHDPSGIDMIRDIRDRSEEFLENCDDLDIIDIKENFEVKQIGLNHQQVLKYNPPENPAKKTDPRYKQYKKRFGFETSWEVDALEPSVLVKLTKKAILNLIDEERYLAWFDKIKVDKEKLRGFKRLADKG